MTIVGAMTANTTDSPKADSFVDWFSKCWTPTYEWYHELYVRLEIGLIAIGIVCNSLSIVILRRDGSFKPTTRFLLQMLAVADTVFVVICLVADVTPLPYVGQLTSVGLAAAVWTVVAVTVERYIAICHPLHAVHYLTTTRIRAAVGAVWIGSVLFAVPRAFEVPLELAGSKFYFMVYQTFAYFVVIFFTPFSVLLFLNCRLIGAVRQSSMTLAQLQVQQQQQQPGDVVDERRATLTLIVVVVVFLVCQLPTIVARLCNILFDNDVVVRSCRSWGLFAATNRVGNLFLVVNSAVNFLIYALVGRRFRQILLRVLRCRRGDASPQSPSGTSGRFVAAFQSPA